MPRAGPHPPGARTLPIPEPLGEQFRDRPIGIIHEQRGFAKAQESTGVPSAWYEAPTFYFTNPHAVIGANDNVPIFPTSEAFDFECELATIIGKSGRDIPADQARDHIAG